MKRFHVHVSVDDIAVATRFYATLFGAEPTVTKPDYAKWMLDDPRVNFAISNRGAAGLDHVGIQVDEPAELGEIHERLERAGESIADKGAATCCYAQSEKGWVTDPAGLSWETFRTFGESTTYGSAEPVSDAEEGCCAATPTTRSGCGSTANGGAAMPARACCAPSAL